MHNEGQCEQNEKHEELFKILRAQSDIPEEQVVSPAAQVSYFSAQREEKKYGARVCRNGSCITQISYESLEEYYKDHGVCPYNHVCLL